MLALTSPNFLGRSIFFKELFIGGNIAWWATHPMPKEKKRHLTTSFYGTEVVKEAFGNIAKFGKITAPPQFFCDFGKNEYSSPPFLFHHIKEHMPRTKSWKFEQNLSATFLAVNSSRDPFMGFWNHPTRFTIGKT